MDPVTRFGFARLPAAILVAASLSPFWPVSSFAAAPNGWEKMTFTEKMSVLHDELRGLMDLEAIPSAHSYKILSAEARQNIDDFFAISPIQATMAKTKTLPSSPWIIWIWRIMSGLCEAPSVSPREA